MKTRPITVEEFTEIITAIKEGFVYREAGKDKKFRANTRMAFALQLQANLGIRVGDVLALTPNSFKLNGRGGYMIDIIERMETSTLLGIITVVLTVIGLLGTLIGFIIKLAKYFPAIPSQI